MEHFRVALLQLRSGPSLEENRKIGLEACRRAKAMGALGKALKNDNAKE